VTVTLKVTVTYLENEIIFFASWRLRQSWASQSKNQSSNK
jgi:hypothetical protein